MGSGQNSKVLLAFVALVALTTTSPVQAAIFGADDRVPVTPGSTMADRSRSVAVGILSTLHEPAADGSETILADSLEGFLCSDLQNPRLARGPSLAYACTGFLVAADLLVTAGHCAVNSGEVKDETASYCDAYDWLFDYQESASGKTKLTGVDKNNLYRCKRIVYAVQESSFPFRDYALIQLDRPVKDRPALEMARNDVVSSNGLSMIGHPLGRPMTLSRNAKILLNDPRRQSFITNLDAFEGNSGSPVFDARGVVVGLLIGGTPQSSLYDDSKAQCTRLNACDDDAKNCAVPDADTSIFPGFQSTGSEVQRIAPIVELLKTKP